MRSKAIILRSIFPALPLLLVLFVGCDGPADPVVSDEATVLVASKLSVLALTVAAGPRDRAFFDNFLPCARRGVVDYRETSAGRSVTFSGCDLGDGVVVDGTAELRWVGAKPSFERGTPSRLDLVGKVEVQIAGSESVIVEQMGVEGITFRAGTDPFSGRASWPVLEGLVLESLRVSLGGHTVGVDERAHPRHVFDPPGLNLNSIPNPSGGLAALTEADTKRLAYHFAIRLLGILFDETLEYGRGPHTHDIGCGTVRVLQDTARRLPRIENAWKECSLGPGLFVDGTFTEEWGELNPPVGRLSMIVQGRFTVGGGIPGATFTRLEWTLTGVSSYPANARISGRLLGENGEQRTFSFDLVLDD